MYSYMKMIHVTKIEIFYSGSKADPRNTNTKISIYVLCRRLGKSMLFLFFTPLSSLPTKWLRILEFYFQSEFEGLGLLFA